MNRLTAEKNIETNELNKERRHLEDFGKTERYFIQLIKARRVFYSLTLSNFPNRALHLETKPLP